MFEQEVSALLDIVAYIEDEELRTELEDVIPSTARAISRARNQKNIEDKKNSDGICTFNEAWQGRCSKSGFPYCPEHASMTCRTCGEQATHTCAETFSLVCGEPLCGKHGCTMRRR